MNASSEDRGPGIEQPWYRQLWPWLVMAPPAASVVAGFATLYLAGSIPSLVVQDYGRIDAESRLDYVRDQQATNLGLTARLELTPRPGGGASDLVVTLAETLAEPASGPAPASLEVAFVHPTLEKLDRRAELLAVGSGIYRGSIEHPPGRYHVQVTDPSSSWRLAGEIGPDTSTVLLVARTRAAAEAGP